MNLEQQIAKLLNVELGFCNEWCEDCIVYDLKNTTEILNILPDKSIAQITDDFGNVLREAKYKIVLE